MRVESLYKLLLTVVIRLVAQNLEVPTPKLLLADAQFFEM